MKNLKSKKGMTLIELVIAMAVTGIVLTMGMAFMFTVSSYMAASSFETDVSAELQLTDNKLRQWFNQTVISGNTNTLAPVTNDNLKTTYLIFADNKLTIHYDENTSETLQFNHIQSMEFTLYDSDSGTGEKILFVCNIGYIQSKDDTEIQTYRIILSKKTV